MIQPVKAPISSHFGIRVHPITGIKKLHAGIDFAAPTGADVHAAQTGHVIHAGTKGGYGNCIMIDHSQGISSLYGHLSNIDVKKGQVVKQGDKIGDVGTTGASTGPHLHFEVRRDNVPIDPAPWLNGK